MHTKRALLPWRAGFWHTRLQAMKPSTAGAGPAVHFHQPVASRNLKRPIKPERNISTRLVFKIIAGKAAGERDLDGAEIHPRETAAASRSIFLVAQRAAFEPQRGVNRSPSRTSDQYSWKAVP